MTYFYKFTPYIMGVMFLGACGGGAAPSMPTQAAADTTPPVITLAGGASLDVEQTTTFTDPGASARDNRDGSVTVTSAGTVDANAAGSYTITYTATDAAGNTATVTRSVNVADTMGPVIRLSGEAQEDLPYGVEFADDGATSTDAVDGDVTVNVEGAVDGFAAGTYSLTYTAEDLAGNTSSAVRTINIGQPQARLDVSVFGEGNVTLSDGTALECNDIGTMCTASFDRGTVVTLNAAPIGDWDFNRWTACEQTDAASCTVTLDRDRTVLTGFSNRAPLVFEAGVFKLTDAQVADIANFRLDRDILSFNVGADLTNIEIGNIIYTDATSDSDIFFAKRIEDIIPLGGSTTLVETINVSMDEMISVGTVSVDPTLEVNQKSLPEGVTYKNSVDASGKSIPTLTFTSVRLNGPSEAVEITMSGSLGLGLLPVLDFDFTLRDGLRAARVAVEQALEADLSVNIEGSIPGLSGGEKTIDFPPIPFGAFAAGPFIFTAEIVPVVNISASMDVTVTPNLTLSQEAIAGVQWYAESGFTNLSSFGFDAGLDETELLRGSVEVEGGMGPQFGLKLYGVAGPTIEALGVVGVKLEASAFEQECPYSLGLYVGAKTSVGGEVRVFSKKLAIQSAEVSFTRPIREHKIFCDQDVTAPDEPFGVTVAAVSSMQINLSWFNVNSDLDITSYQIWRRDRNFGRARLVATTDSANLGYSDVSLQPETEYCYYIRTLDHAGNRSPIPSTGFICATTPKAEDSEPPTAPTGLVATSVSSSSINLTWEASTDNDAVGGYIVINSTQEGADAYQIGEAEVPDGTVSRLNAETEYCFNVVAVDLSGNVSELSERICATTQPKSEAEWTAFIGCQGREFLLEEKLEIEETENSVVELAASGIDYTGTPLSYILAGIYQPETGILDAEINWSFEGQSNVRQDQFEANLLEGDSGVVFMRQTRVTGCDAQIQFVQNTDEAGKTQQSLQTPAVSAALTGNPYGLITGF